MISLAGIASNLGGRVHGDHVVAPGPEAASKRGRKARRRTVTIYTGKDGDIRVNCHHKDHDPIAVKDWVRARCGLPEWKPTRKRAEPRPLPPTKIRNQFLQESLRIARTRPSIDFQQFCLIVNDLKNSSSGDDRLESFARLLADEFGFGAEAAEEALRPAWRAYGADERAAIWRMEQDERLRLRLRRTGCIDLDAAGRERARRDRYNAKRRAAREAARAGVNKRMPSSQKVKEETLPVPETAVEGKTPSETSKEEPASQARAILARRLADEYDAAQERGEARTRADNQRASSGMEEAVGVSDLGLSHKQIHEARTIRDAHEGNHAVRPLLSLPDMATSAPGCARPRPSYVHRAGLWTARHPCRPHRQ